MQYSSWLSYYWKGIILAYSDTNSYGDLCLALLEISSKVSVYSLQSRILKGLSNNYIPLNVTEMQNTCTSLNYKTYFIKENYFILKKKKICITSNLFASLHIWGFLHLSRDIEQQRPRPPWYSLCPYFKELMCLGWFPSISRSICLLLFLNSMLI